MDLVSTIRKSGSRGGRDAFSWDDVKNDKDRENYLGHSLLAPVGRWQKGKDLSWYAKKGSDGAAQEDEATRRKEELRAIKERENDALSEALGFRVSTNRPRDELDKDEVQRLLKESVGNEDEAGTTARQIAGGKGLGYGAYQGESPIEPSERSRPSPREQMRPKSSSRDPAADGNIRERAHGSRDHDSKREPRSRRHRSRSPGHRDRKHERRRDPSRSRSRSRSRERRREPDHRRHEKYRRSQSPRPHRRRRSRSRSPRPGKYRSRSPHHRSHRR